MTAVKIVKKQQPKNINCVIKRRHEWNIINSEEKIKHI